MKRSTMRHAGGKPPAQHTAAKHTQPLQPPLPLQSFLPLQEFASVLQPPLPLQSFLPLQSCLAPAASAASAAGAAASAASGAAGVAGASGVAGGGVEPPQADAPAMIPVTAAAIRVFVRFIAISLVKLANPSAHLGYTGLVVRGVSRLWSCER